VIDVREQLTQILPKLIEHRHLLHSEPELLYEVDKTVLSQIIFLTHHLVMLDDRCQLHHVFKIFFATEPFEHHSQNYRCNGWWVHISYK